MLSRRVARDLFQPVPSSAGPGPGVAGARGTSGRQDLAPPSATASPLWEACRQAGLHLTPRRRALLVVFDEAREPLCVETFHDRLMARGLRTSRSTLYKLIADLLEAGVLVEYLGRDRRRYRAAQAG